MTLARDIETKFSISDMSVDDVREMTDADELQELIDDLERTAISIKDQIDLRTNPKAEWERRAIAAHTHAKVLRTEAIRAHNKASGRAERNAENDGHLRVAKQLKETNNLEKHRQRQEEAKLKKDKALIHTLNRVVRVMNDSQLSRAFMDIARNELDHDKFTEMRTAAEGMVLEQSIQSLMPVGLAHFESRMTKEREQSKEKIDG